MHRSLGWARLSVVTEARAARPVRVQRTLGNRNGDSWLLLEEQISLAQGLGSCLYLDYSFPSKVRGVRSDGGTP